MGCCWDCHPKKLQRALKSCTCPTKLCMLDAMCVTSSHVATKQDGKLTTRRKHSILAAGNCAMGNSLERLHKQAGTTTGPQIIIIMQYAPLSSCTKFTMWRPSACLTRLTAAAGCLKRHMLASTRM